MIDISKSKSSITIKINFNALKNKMLEINNDITDNDVKNVFDIIYQYFEKEDFVHSEINKIINQYLLNNK